MTETPPEASITSSCWHCSPWVDVLVYHFGWLWALIPLLCMTDSSENRISLYFILYLITFIHRHFGFIYAYLDKNNFRRNPRQLTIFPSVMLGLLFFTPVLYHLTLPAGLTLFGERSWFGVLEATVTLRLIWSNYHTFMQKYGILRIYNHKFSQSYGLAVPGWVDKVFLLGWFPLFAVYLCTKHLPLVIRYAGHISWLKSLIIFNYRNQFYLYPIAIFALLVSVVLFLYHEWQASRFRNIQRLSNALGTSLLYLSLLLFPPFKVLLAFAFNHAIEYVAFVMTFLKRSYQKPQITPSLLSKLLRFPIITYFHVLGGLTIIYYFFHHFDDSPSPPRLFGVGIVLWFFAYEEFVNLIHLYTDGVIWKVRRPEIQQNL